MKACTLFGSSTFRLALVYMLLFASSVLVLLGFIYWSTVGYMSVENDATIEAEITALAEKYRERRSKGLGKTDLRACQTRPGQFDRLSADIT